MCSLLLAVAVALEAVIQLIDDSIDICLCLRTIFLRRHSMCA